MQDNLLAVCVGYLSVCLANAMGVVWIGEGFKAVVLGFAGSAGGFIAKATIQYAIKKLKSKTKYNK